MFHFSSAIGTCQCTISILERRLKDGDQTPTCTET
jgi:hypothetical protein